MDLDSCLNFFLGLCTKVQSWWSSSYKFPPHPCTSLYFSPPYVSVVRLFLRFTTLCHKDLHTCQCLHRAGVDIAPSHFNMGHIICLNDTYYLSLRCLKSKIYYILKCLGGNDLYLMKEKSILCGKEARSNSIHQETFI